MLAEHKAPVYDTTGLRLVTASVRRPGPDVLDPKIHHNNLLNSILAKMEANVAGADDALMLDGRGFVAETNATHLFAVVGGRAGSRRARSPARRASPGRPCWTWPPTPASPAAVRDVSLAEMYAADEVFCTGTMGEIAGVTAIDGRPIGAGTVGPVTAGVAALYQAHARATRRTRDCCESWCAASSS